MEHWRGCRLPGRIRKREKYDPERSQGKYTMACCFQAFHSGTGIGDGLACAVIQTNITFENKMSTSNQCQSKNNPENSGILA
jgi:hypothetical protein